MADPIPLISISQLAVAARKTLESIEAKPYSQFVVDQASATVCDLANHPEWEFDVVPPRLARTICMQIAVRALLNPELETSYSVGPLSGRSRDEWAYGFEPTPYEAEQLAELAAIGGPGGLWIQPTDGGLEELADVILKYDQWDGQPIIYQNAEDVGTGYDEDDS